MGENLQCGAGIIRNAGIIREMALYEEICNTIMYDWKKVSGLFQIANSELKIKGAIKGKQNYNMLKQWMIPSAYIQRLKSKLKEIWLSHDEKQNFTIKAKLLLHLGINEDEKRCFLK